MWNLETVRFKCMIQAKERKQEILRLKQDLIEVEGLCYKNVYVVCYML